MSLDKGITHIVDRFGGDRRHAVMLAFAVLFAVLTYGHAVVKIVIVEKNFGDFANYYLNATKLNEGVNVYLLTEPEENRLRDSSGIPVNVCAGPGYAPVVQYFFGVLAKLGFWNALALWLTLNHVLLVGLIVAIPALGGRDPIALFAGLFFLFAAQPFIENIGLGQINLAILFLLTSSILLYRSGRSGVLCGALIAFATILKPQYGIFTLFFLWKREYRIVLSAVLAYGLLRIAGAMIYGLDVEAASWSYILSRPANVELASVSVKGISDRVLMGLPHGGLLSWLITALVSGAMLIASFRAISRDGSRGDALAEFSLMIPLAILLCPISYEHYLVMMFIPFLALVGKSEWKGSSVALFLAAFCLVSLRYSFQRFDFFTTGWPAALSAGKTMGVFLAWILLRQQLRSGRRNGPLSA